MSKLIKQILVIEVEAEKDFPDLIGEVCRRITMHPHVANAEPVSVALSMEHTRAPKPGGRSYIGKTE
jgi:hypothetical protein